MNNHPITKSAPGTVLWKAIVNIAQNCHLERKDLQEILGFSSATLSRLYQEKHFINPTSKEGEIALLLVRLYKSLLANVGNDDQAAKEWLRSYNYYFNAIPLEHIRKITGLTQVVIYLDAMRGKL